MYYVTSIGYKMNQGVRRLPLRVLKGQNNTKNMMKGILSIIFSCVLFIVALGDHHDPHDIFYELYCEHHDVEYLRACLHKLPEYRGIMPIFYDCIDEVQPGLDTPEKRKQFFCGDDGIKKFKELDDLLHVKFTEGQLHVFDESMTKCLAEKENQK
ncbi:uncharacterized protein LOC111627610 [Centruroides sculpturatus]|uniref:uncharacterized protein LOC111627610 n=1 Tax=Centruroides sculpturatus TaxID=218467 RepID=UPI000C6CB848|nr:uncharacterized protein LOC111627610 [Centruroides sculpturatus]